MAEKISERSFLLFLAKEISLVPLKLKPKSTKTVKKTANDCANITSPNFSVPKVLTKKGRINNGSK